MREANDVYVDVTILDVLDHPAPTEPRHDVILVGDLFYERDTAARALAFLERHAATGTRVLIGDPGRTYLPKERLTRARRIFRAGDARAGGSGDQAHDGLGVEVHSALILRNEAEGRVSRRMAACSVYVAILRDASLRDAPQDEDLLENSP